MKNLFGGGFLLSHAASARHGEARRKADEARAERLVLTPGEEAICAALGAQPSVSRPRGQAPQCSG